MRQRPGWAVLPTRRGRRRSYGRIMKRTDPAPSRSTTAPEPALTVEQQAERIATLESTLFNVEIIVERAMRKGYSPDAYELAEALGLDEEE